MTATSTAPPADELEELIGFLAATGLPAPVLAGALDIVIGLTASPEGLARLKQRLAPLLQALLRALGQKVRAARSHAPLGRHCHHQHHCCMHIMAHPPQHGTRLCSCRGERGSRRRLRLRSALLLLRLLRRLLHAHTKQPACCLCMQTQPALLLRNAQDAALAGKVVGSLVNLSQDPAAAGEMLKMNTVGRCMDYLKEGTCTCSPRLLVGGGGWCRGGQLLDAGAAAGACGHVLARAPGQQARRAPCPTTWRTGPCPWLCWPCAGHAAEQPVGVGAGVEGCAAAGPGQDGGAARVSGAPDSRTLLMPATNCRLGWRHMRLDAPMPRQITVQGCAAETVCGGGRELGAGARGRV